jgi:hypothetical protein
MSRKSKLEKYDDSTVIGGKTLAEWDQSWAKRDGGYKVPHPNLRHVVGLFRAVLSGEVVFVGQGTEYRRGGGLAKRLADFRRPSPSARKHAAGQLIRKHMDDLTLEVLETGSGRTASETAKLLKTAMLAWRRPRWNFQKSKKA